MPGCMKCAPISINQLIIQSCEECELAMLNKTNWLSYSGKLLREKSVVNFKVWWVLAKVFFTKFGGVASLAAQASNP